MRLLRLFFLATLPVLLCAAYIAHPFATAWAIREAVTHGDTAYIERKVQWPSVRESMRQSMLTVALDLPVPGAEPAGAGEADAAAMPRPGLWSRVKTRLKSYVGQRAVDKMVASYVTAEGLPRLYRQRMMAKSLTGQASPEDQPWSERFAEVWSRIRRAEFKSLTALEIELADQFEAERSYVARLELKRLEWLLTELRIVRAEVAVATR